MHNGRLPISSLVFFVVVIVGFCCEKLKYLLALFYGHHQSLSAWLVVCALERKGLHSIELKSIGFIANGQWDMKSKHLSLVCKQTIPRTLELASEQSTSQE